MKRRKELMKQSMILVKGVIVNDAEVYGELPIRDKFGNLSPSFAIEVLSLVNGPLTRL